jgi:hypothetical protein
MFDIHVFKALTTQTSIKIGRISFNVTTPEKDRGTRLVPERPEDRKIHWGVTEADCSRFLPAKPIVIDYSSIPDRASGFSAILARGHPRR